MSKRGAAAVTIAFMTVVVSGIVGVRAQTPPEELACRFFGVSASETSHIRPTPTEAAQAYAAGMRDKDRPIPTFRAVIDVTDSARPAGDKPPQDGKAFAVRNHGQTVALLFVTRTSGGWDVTRS